MKILKLVEKIIKIILIILIQFLFFIYKIIYNFWKKNKSKIKNILQSLEKELKSEIQ